VSIPWQIIMSGLILVISFSRLISQVLVLISRIVLSLMILNPFIFSILGPIILGPNIFSTVFL
jgi:hypothetical protein